MSVATQDRFWRLNNPVLWGVVITAMFLVMYSNWAIQEDCGEIGCEANWQKFLASSPNEIGDALAGAFGGLAFLWIIVTVFLQSQELREQRKELCLARGEYEKMADAMQKQANVADQQIAILRGEQRQRDEIRADELFLTVCEEVFEVTSSLVYLTWYIDEGRRSESPISLRFLYEKGQNWQQNLSALCSIIDAIEKLEWRCQKQELFPDNRRPREVGELIDTLNKIVRLKPRLSEVIVYKLERIEIEPLIEGLEKLQNDNAFWLPKLGMERS